ncbi:hypothetical protein RHECNPAF_3500058 [Rhizobium etli CNPAF512]|nr:hypothetical protein RHECNPAF_3500058 [Rhizobium etli CNPAF512]
MPRHEVRTFSLASRMNHLALFPNVKIEESLFEIPIGKQRNGKII